MCPLSQLSIFGIDCDASVLPKTMHMISLKQRQPTMVNLLRQARTQRSARHAAALAPYSHPVRKNHGNSRLIYRYRLTEGSDKAAVFVEPLNRAADLVRDMHPHICNSASKAARQRLENSLHRER